MSDYLDEGQPPTVASSERRARAALGPRLKSYLSTTNLLNLGHSVEDDDSVKIESEWPDFIGYHDESTVSPGANFTALVLAIRTRLWNHDDQPLDVSYNAPLFWATDECLRVSKENDQLREQLVEVEKQNRDLLDQVVSLASLVRQNSSNSGTGTIRGLDPCSTTTRRQHSKSTSAIPGYLSTLGMPKADSTLHRDTLTPPSPGYTGPRMSFSTSDNSDGPQDFLPDEQAEFRSRQEAALRLALYVADRAGNDLQDHYPEIAQILRVPVILPTGLGPSLQSGGSTPEHFEDAICMPTQTHMETETGTTSSSSGSEAKIATTQQQRSSAGQNHERTEEFVQSQRRLFSFYPGDDKDAIDSLLQYSNEQRPSIHIEPPSSIIKPQANQAKNPTPSIQPASNTHLGRGDSQDSVVTVVKAPQSKIPLNRSTSQDNTIGSKKVAPRAPSGGQKAPEKHQGPFSVAAALVATARFAKNGKKTTSK